MMAEAAGRTMEANRETDGLIAMRVFELAVVCDWRLPPEHADSLYVVTDFRHGQEYTTDVPRYSEDIAAAWLVVEHFHERDWIWQIGYFSDGSMRVIVNLYPRGPQGKPDPDIEVDADTVPLALCKAALQAIGVERPDADTREVIKQ